MISFLRGRPAAAGSDYVIIDVSGIGYKVYVPTPVVRALTDPGVETTIFTYMHVREDALQLYGCLSEMDLSIFEYLIQISGVGPKVALAVLSSMSVPAFIQAVLGEEVDSLTRVPGVGKKTAQRIIIELKDKLGKLDTGLETGPVGSVPGLPDVVNDALQALMTLGYNAVEARRVLGKIDFSKSGAISSEELIKIALKELARL